MTRTQRIWALAAALAAALFACAVGILITASAAPAEQPTLVYDGASKSFSYRHVDGSDLFASFKDLVPGDRLTQRFAVQVVNLDRPTALYLRTDYDTADAADLDAIELAVSASGANLSDGAIGSDHRLERDTKLASLVEDGSFQAEVTITVPTSVGNELADSSHRLRWVFTAQEDGETPDGDGRESTGNEPQATGATGAAATAASNAITRTGDPALPLAPLAVLAAAAFSLFIVAARQARRP